MTLKQLSDEELKMFKKNKPLDKPVKSTRAGKKGMVYTIKDGKVRLIHFGDSSMEDFTQHKDEKRRKAYLARAKGIKNKDGELTWKLRSSPNYWSVKILWSG